MSRVLAARVPQIVQHLRRHFWITAASAWFVLLIIAMLLDRPIAAALHRSGIDSVIHDAWISGVWKLPGTFLFAVLLVITLVALGKFTYREGVYVLVAGILAGSNVVLKWVVGRTRPFKLDMSGEPRPFYLQPFWQGVYGFFHQRDLSFPSGHECSAFVLAVAIALIRPLWGWIFFILAAAVGLERILENAHYFSDVVAAMPVGLAGGYLARFLVRPQESTPLAGYDSSTDFS